MSVRKPRTSSVHQSQLRLEFFPRWYTQTIVILQHISENVGNTSPSGPAAIDSGEVGAIIERLSVVSQLPIGRRFSPPEFSLMKIPRIPSWRANQDVGDSLSRQLDGLVHRAPAFVSAAVSFYAQNVQKDQGIVFIPGRLEDECRTWITLVRRLEPHVELRFTGFRIKEHQRDLGSQLRLLDVNPKTAIHRWVQGKNQKSDSQLHHLGIDVVQRRTVSGKPVFQSSGIFWFVMAIATIAEPWKLIDTRDNDPRSSDAKGPGKA